MTTTTSCRIINPATGAVVCDDAITVEPPAFAIPNPGVVWVQLRPSVRPGMLYDLGTYPPEWVVAR